MNTMCMRVLVMCTCAQCLTDYNKGQVKMWATFVRKICRKVGTAEILL